MLETGYMQERDRRLIARAVETLNNNIIARPGGAEGYPFGKWRAIAPSLSTYPGVWNWDAAFHLLAMSRVEPEIARDQARILFAYQKENGQLADVIYTTGDAVFRFTKPPVLAWAIQGADRISPDDVFLACCYPHLARNLDWWERYRFDGKLFSYRVSKMESGWDNTPRFDFPNRVDWCYAVDLNCYMALFYEAMAYIARRTGRGELAGGYLARHDALAENIEQLLYHEERGWYCDYNRVLRRPTCRLSPASFLPLFARVAAPERAAAMAKLAADPAYFYPGLPTIAYNDRAYRSSNYWRGPTWLNTAYFAVCGLRQYGYQALARDLIERILSWCDQNEDAIYEYYDSRSGKGLGARGFGWSAAFIIELVLLRYGAGEGGAA